MKISSPGDLEVSVLYEAHSLLADIISAELYEVVGKPTEQSIHFKEQCRFHLFIIHAAELWQEARANALVDGAPNNLSILSGLNWAAENRLNEPSVETLRARIWELEFWLDQNDPAHFWCSDVNRHFYLVTLTKNHFGILREYIETHGFSIAECC